MAALYICYQSLLEPLTQTQVVAYLEGLCQAGYRLILLTFEPRPLSSAETREWRERLAARGIAWHWCRYHKRPTVPATAFDVVVGIVVGWWLVRRYKVRLLHARVHVPGLMALVLKYLTGARFLFDIRGFMAEEYVDAGVWKAGGVLFRITKRVERALVRAADGYVVLTHKAKDMLHSWYPRETAGKPLQIIPCCIDFRHVPKPEQAGPNGQAKALTYVGKLGGWYLTREMVDFTAAAVEAVPGLRWRVWTQSDPAPLRQAIAAAGLQGAVDIGRLPPEAVAGELARSQAGLSFIKPCLSKWASSPTKVPEYLAAGLPVAGTAGIGDTDDILTEPTKGGKPVGVLVHEFTPTAYREAVRQLRQLWEDPETPARCRAAAETHYHLEHVGWARYRRLYQDLLAGRA